MLKQSEASQTNLSLDLYQKQEYQKSKKITQQILQKNPQNETMLINMGNILFIEKKYDEALVYYQQAETIKPELLSVKINIANVFLEQGKYADAIIYAKDVLQKDDTNFTALNIIGSALLGEEKYQDAIPYLEHALSINTQDAWIYNYLSQCYQHEQKFSQALEHGWQAIEKSFGDENQHINFGYMLYEIGLEKNTSEIKTYVSKWLEKYGENKIVEHMGKSLLSGGDVKRASAEYVKNIFDIFASDFEKVLQDLEYKTPELIGKFLEEIYQKEKSKLKILDAGCGTGLCGKYLHPYARFWSLDGVDLSEKMLAKAKEKNFYHHLFCEDLISFCQKQNHKYDLIVSADVFTYFGDLDSLFLALSQALKKQGRLIFSITANQENDAPYLLHPSGRFKHGLSYVEGLLKKVGFAVEKEEFCFLRKEGQEDVKGYLISAVRT